MWGVVAEGLVKINCLLRFYVVNWKIAWRMVIVCSCLPTNYNSTGTSILKLHKLLLHSTENPKWIWRLWAGLWGCRRWPTGWVAATSPVLCMITVCQPWASFRSEEKAIYKVMLILFKKKKKKVTRMRIEVQKKLPAFPFLLPMHGLSGLFYYSLLLFVSVPSF